MAPIAILDCQIRKNLLADGVWRAETHHSTKFRHNRPFRYRDIAIFGIFKKAASAILNKTPSLGPSLGIRSTVKSRLGFVV